MGGNEEGIKRHTMVWRGEWMGVENGWEERNAIERERSSQL
jgi:hypothetical protein